jgi:hypothetical protein
MKFVDQEKILLVDKTSGWQQVNHSQKGIMQHVDLFRAAREHFWQLKFKPDSQIQVIGYLNIAVKTQYRENRFKVFDLHVDFQLENV